MVSVFQSLEFVPPVSTAFNFQVCSLCDVASLSLILFLHNYFLVIIKNAFYSHVCVCLHVGICLNVQVSLVPGRELLIPWSQRYSSCELRTQASARTGSALGWGNHPFSPTNSFLKFPFTYLALADSPFLWTVLLFLINTFSAYLQTDSLWPDCFCVVSYLLRCNSFGGRG